MMLKTAIYALVFVLALVDAYLVAGLFNYLAHEWMASNAPIATWKQGLAALFLVRTLTGARFDFDSYAERFRS